MIQNYPMIPQSGEIIIYNSPDGQTQLDVHLDKDTVWLNVNQMAVLFGRDSKTIRKHIDNALKEELADEVVVAKFETTTQHEPTVAKFETVQIEGGREVIREISYFNLDVIISVGYRVKSKNGVAFRRWANRVLKEYLVRGYAINNKLAAQKYEELSQLVQILGRTIQSQPELTNKESSDLVAIEKALAE